MNDNGINLFLGIVTVFGLIILMSWVLPMAFDKQMKAECYTWQKQAEQYPLFYLTEWQEEQCDELGIEIIVKQY